MPAGSARSRRSPTSCWLCAHLRNGYTKLESTTTPRVRVTVLFDPTDRLDHLGHLAGMLDISLAPGQTTRPNLGPCTAT